MMKYMLLIAIGLFVGCAAGQDWLGTGPVYVSSYYPYPTYNANIYYYPYSDYNAYIPVYPDYRYNAYIPIDPDYQYNAYIPVYSGDYLIPYTVSKWWPSHKNLEKTLSIARASSSIRVYSHGSWTGPGL